MAAPFDPLSPEVREDPYPFYRALRRAGALHEMVGGGFVLVRNADVRAALSRPDLFSSTAMQALIERADDTDEEPMPETLLGSDPPTHTSLRKLVNRGFSRRRVASLEQRVREIAADLGSGLAARHEFDLIGDFASPLTVRMIAELLGVDPERHCDFRRWSDALILLVSGELEGNAAACAWREKQALSDFLDAIVEARRRCPGDDLISDLVRLERDGGPLGPREVDFLPYLLLTAGNETTTHLIGNLMTQLFAHPTQLELLAARPDLIANAVEEGLRFDSPIQLVLRTTKRDVEVEGVRIPAGRRVALSLGSANRDERAFAHADRFDVARDASRHLGFGLGTHFCLGAPLARLEARIALETLLPMRLRAAGDPGPRIASILVRGYRRLPVARGRAARIAG